MSLLADIALVLLAGFGAGFLNVTVGGGSILSLPVLLLMGLPPHVSVGTNRLAVTFHALTGLVKYWKEGKVTLRPLLIIAPPSLLGSVLGARLILTLDETIVKHIISGALTLLFFFFLLSPRFGLEERPPRRSRRWIGIVVAFVLGVYGGFLGIGVTTFFIAFLVLTSGHTFVRATAATQAAVFLLSLTATFVFALEGAINYMLAFALALSMSAGAYTGAAVAVRFGNRFVRLLFLCMIAVLLLSLLGIPTVIGQIWHSILG